MHCTQQYDRLNHPLIINMIPHQSKWFCVFLTFAIVVPKVSIPFLGIAFITKQVLLDGANTAEGRVRDNLSDGCQDGVERDDVAAPDVRGQVRGRGQHTRVTNVREDFTITEKAPTRAISLFNIVQLLLQYSLHISLSSVYLEQ